MKKFWVLVALVLGSLATLAIGIVISNTPMIIVGASLCFILVVYMFLSMLSEVDKP